MAQIKILKFNSEGLPLEHSSGADELTMLSMQAGNVKMSANAVISTDTDGDLALTPDGAGNLVLDGLNWPQADGSANQIIYTDGAGQLAFANLGEIAETISYTADEALLIRDFVYVSAADNVSKVDASALATSRGIGFATAAAADTESVPVQSEGILSGFSGMTAGAVQYADPSNAGLLTETLPTGSGNVIVQGGIAKSATVLHIQIQRLGQRV